MIPHTNFNNRQISKCVHTRTGWGCCGTKVHTVHNGITTQSKWKTCAAFKYDLRRRRREKEVHTLTYTHVHANFNIYSHVMILNIFNEEKMLSEEGADFRGGRVRKYQWYRDEYGTKRIPAYRQTMTKHLAIKLSIKRLISMHQYQGAQ